MGSRTQTRYILLIHFLESTYLRLSTRSTATLASNTHSPTYSPPPPPPQHPTPSLYYSPVTHDRDRESTVDSAEASTPQSFSPSRPPRSQLPRTRQLHTNSNYSFDSTRPRDNHRCLDTSFDDLVFLEEEGEDDARAHTLFPPSQITSKFAMASTNSPPIDIATPRNSPPPTGQQTSNLTSQLQAARAQQPSQSYKRSPFLEPRRGSEMMSESFGNAYGSSFHSRPIAMADRNRRESNNMAGSLMGGMSWGGLSVGSFIRDE